MTGQGKNAMDSLLADSLKELVKKHPIEKITIKEITDKAGVIRPTFYNHFQDKYELLEWIIITEVLEPILPLLKNNMVDQAMLLLFSSIEREKSFYTKISHMEGQNSFSQIFKDGVRRILLQILAESENKSVESKKNQFHCLTPELIADYYAQSIGFFVIRWIEQNMDITPEELSKVTNFMMQRSLLDYLMAE